jgi:hypothetical protein
MSEGLLRRFLDNLTRVPEEKPPLIPKQWRIPFFAGMSIVAFVLLVLLVWLVVLPAIRSQHAEISLPLAQRVSASTSERGAT